ncbi:hypothetical protein [Candidatus Uabimicrobium sp. HlEnr_7]|uniref:hypothetical protein n=1 Tax=Candidatus Uabimicrobium helgolandensis TaxID=3095367 RepID=UPI003557B50F
MNRTLLLIILVLIFSPIFISAIEYKNIKMASRPAIWQKQLEQDGKDGWRFIEVSSGWATLIRESDKTPVTYFFAKTFKRFSKYQELIEEKANEGLRAHGRYDGRYIFSKYTKSNSKVQNKFTKKALITARWKKQIEQEGKESWVLVDIDSGWFIFVKENTQAIDYNFVKSFSNSKKRLQQIKTEGKENWIYLFKHGGWLIFAK